MLGLSARAVPREGGLLKPIPVQKCKSADGRCKSGKVNDKTGRGVAEAGKITEYGVRIWEA